MRRDPRACGLARSRWRLADVLAACPGLGLRTPQGLGRLLARLGIAYKRGRDYVHSPDPDYAAKLAALRSAHAAVLADPERRVLVYLDEVTVGRQPTRERAWEAVGRDQPRARRSHRSDSPTRLVGALDAATGAVHGLRAGAITVAALVRFLRQVRAAYPRAAAITVVLDNWSNHFPPDLLAALEPQTAPFPFRVPANWSPDPSPAARQRWGGLRLPIQLLPLPTYASWLNPVEQLWRKLRQDLGHLHPFADDLPRLRAELDAWLAAHHQPSPDLLRYVGLGTHD